MAQVLTQARLLHSSSVSAPSTARRSTICRVQQQSANKKKATNHGTGMYKNMTPLEEKATDAPNLNVFEVQDTSTKNTLDHLFYQMPKEEHEHASCVKMPGVGLVCGSEEFLLHETHGCIHAGGVYYALPHDAVHDPTVDITDDTYELLDGLSQATFDRMERMEEI